MVELLDYDFVLDLNSTAKVLEVLAARSDEYQPEALRWEELWGLGNYDFFFRVFLSDFL